MRQLIAGDSLCDENQVEFCKGKKIRSQAIICTCLSPELVCRAGWPFIDLGWGQDLTLFSNCLATQVFWELWVRECASQPGLRVSLLCSMDGVTMSFAEIEGWEVGGVGAWEKRGQTSWTSSCNGDYEHFLFALTQSWFKLAEIILTTS